MWAPSSGVPGRSARRSSAAPDRRTVSDASLAPKLLPGAVVDDGQVIPLGAGDPSVGPEVHPRADVGCGRPRGAADRQAPVAVSRRARSATMPATVEPSATPWRIPAAGAAASAACSPRPPLLTEPDGPPARRPHRPHPPILEWTAPWRRAVQGARQRRADVSVVGSAGSPAKWRSGAGKSLEFASQRGVPRSRNGAADADRGVSGKDAGGSSMSQYGNLR